MSVLDRLEQTTITRNMSSLNSRGSTYSFPLPTTGQLVSGISSNPDGSLIRQETSPFVEGGLPYSDPLPAARVAQPEKSVINEVGCGVDFQRKTFNDIVGQYETTIFPRGFDWTKFGFDRVPTFDELSTLSAIPTSNGIHNPLEKKSEEVILSI